MAWRTHLPDFFPTPHPSRHTTAGLRRNPWFETVLAPELRERVRRIFG